MINSDLSSSGRKRGRPKKGAKVYPRISHLDSEMGLNSSRSSSLELFYERIKDIPLLSVDEEVTLAQQIQRGDEKARHKMILSNLRLVFKIALHYNNLGLSSEDLVSEGMVGLVHASEHFLPHKAKFSSYSSWWIRRFMHEAIARNSGAVSVSTYTANKMIVMSKVANDLHEKIGSEASDMEIALEMKMPEHKVASLRMVRKIPISLQASVNDDLSTQFVEILADHSAPIPSKIFEQNALKRELEESLQLLKGREAEILRHRFGLNGYCPKTLVDVGEIYTLTRERIRQIQNSALIKLRKIFNEKAKLRSAQELDENRLERIRSEMLKEFLETRLHDVSSN